MLTTIPSISCYENLTLEYTRMAFMNCTSALAVNFLPLKEEEHFTEMIQKCAEDKVEKADCLYL